MSNIILKRVVLEPKDMTIVEGVIRDRTLGERGFSAAVRNIIREWDEMKRQTATPTPQDTQK